MPPRKSKTQSSGPETIRVVIEQPQAGGQSRRYSGAKKPTTTTTSPPRGGSDFQVVRLGKGGVLGMGGERYRVDGVGNRPDPENGIRISTLLVRPHGGGRARTEYRVHRDRGLFGEESLGAYGSLREAADVAISRARIDVRESEGRAETKAEAGTARTAEPIEPVEPMESGTGRSQRPQPGARRQQTVDDLDGDGEVEPDEEEITSARDDVSAANARRLDLGDLGHRDPDLKVVNREWVDRSNDLAEAVSEFHQERERETADTQRRERATRIAERFLNVTSAPGRAARSVTRGGRGKIRY